MANYFVSPGAGSDATGDGSIGNPWKSVQYALDNITQGARGDEIHVQAGAADVLSAGLSLATYGTPGISKPLTIRGYTSAARDGGRGEISGDGQYSIYNSGENSSKGYISFIDMVLGNTGSGRVFWGGSPNVLFVNCIFHSCTSAFIETTAVRTSCVGCHFSGNSGNYDIDTSGPYMYIQNCTFEKALGVACVYVSGWTPIIDGCVFRISVDTSLSAVMVSNMAGCYVTNNTIYSSSANTSAGIACSGDTIVVAINNLIAGFSGAGGKGIALAGGWATLGGNAYRNNTTNESISVHMMAVVLPSITLTADPFVNAAGGDFRLKDASLAAGAAWPQSWPGLPNTGNARDIGAAQNALTTDYPLEADVRLGVDYAEAAKTGTLAVPVAGNVRAGVAVDNITGTLGIPTAGNVRSGVQYGAANTEYTGVLELPLSGNVLTGVQYGASGTEYTGTMPQTLSIGEGAVIDIIDDLITVEVND